MDAGDFADAVDRHYPGLVQRLTLVLHDGEEAKDVAQEAYLRAFQSWDSFDGTDARAWLHTIGLRLAFNRLRRRRLWDRFGRGERRDPSWVMPERIDLWRALANLKPLKIEIVTARPGDTEETLARRMRGVDRPRELFRALNNIDPGARIPAGTKVKIVAD